MEAQGCIVEELWNLARRAVCIDDHVPAHWMFELFGGTAGGILSADRGPIGCNALEFRDRGRGAAENGSHAPEHSTMMCGSLPRHLIRSMDEQH